jgi:hypothetical protein
LLYRRIIKITARCVNKEVKSFYVIRALELTILSVWTQSWRRLQKANGHVLTVKGRASRSRMMMNTWSSAGKAIPLQALAGPVGSRRLRLPDSKTVGT